MDLRRGDSHLRSEAEPEPVGKASRTVGKDIRRIDLDEKSSDRFGILADDRISVMRSLRFDVLDRLF